MQLKPAILTAILASIVAAVDPTTGIPSGDEIRAVIDGVADIKDLTQPQNKFAEVAATEVANNYYINVAVTSDDYRSTGTGVKNIVKIDYTYRGTVFHALAFGSDVTINFLGDKSTAAWYAVTMSFSPKKCTTTDHSVSC